MIVIQNLLRLNRIQGVLKHYKELDVKYISSYYTNCIHINSLSKINLLPRTYFRLNISKKMSGFKNTSVGNEEKIRIKDDIPNNYTLIYRAPMINYCKLGYPVGLISIILIPSIAFIKCVLLESSLNADDLGPLAIIQSQTELICFVLASTVMGFSLIFFVRRYPFRIFHSPSTKEYIAVLPSATPFKTKKMYFTSASKIDPKDIPLNLFKESVYKLGSKKLLLLAEHFKRPIDLESMLKTSTGTK